MPYGKVKLRVLIGFISATLMVLALFVPTATVFFALLIGLVFVIPLLALVSIVVIGASMVSKRLRKPSVAEKIEVVIST